MPVCIHCCNSPERAACWMKLLNAFAPSVINCANCGKNPEPTWVIVRNAWENGCIDCAQI